MAMFRTTTKDSFSGTQRKDETHGDDEFQYSYDHYSIIAKQFSSADPEGLDIQPLITPPQPKRGWWSRKCWKRAFLAVLAVSVCFFMVIFVGYMIPHEPSTEFRRGEIVLEETGSIKVIETIRLDNPNWQRCHFDNFKLDLFQGSSFLSHTQLDKRKTVDSREVKELDIHFPLDLTASQEEMIRSRCATTQGVSFTMDGHAEAQIWSADFGKVKIGRWTHVLFCVDPNERTPPSPPAEP